jgi:diguanylate cyclase (GGDEF)-like protein/PAS domain S-box-containing protein
MSASLLPEHPVEEIKRLRDRVQDLEATISAIRAGGVDAIIIGGPDDERLFTLTSADRPYRVIVEEMGEGAATVSEGGNILYVNRRLAAMLGREPHDLLGADVAELVVGAADRGLLRRLLSVPAMDTMRAELAFTARDGSIVPMLVSVTGLDIEGTLVRCVVAADLTEMRRSEHRAAAADAAVVYLAFHDELTNLANRSLFVDRLDRAVAQWRRTSEPVAVLFIDLDDFKTVNDSLGHAVGDQLLAAVAKRLRADARADDTLARLGGDEFALLIESGAMPETAELAAERILEAMHEPFAIGELEVGIRMSIGIAVTDAAVSSAQDLLAASDMAMYMAKERGKDRYQLFDPVMRERAIERLTTGTALDHALANNELEVFYQPIVRVADRRPLGVEALLRWHHPSRGLLNPADFIDVAEATGLIMPIGEWVLRESTRRLRHWRDLGVVPRDFYVSVNVSPRQLGGPNLVEMVESGLQEAGLPATALVLEITESSLMLDFDVAAARLRALQSLGVRIAIDDYGTGYSSLRRLSGLPVAVVKIDKSFVDNLDQGTVGVAMVRSIVEVAHALGITTIAEGVENAEQYRALQALDCDAMQGFLFAPALTASPNGDLLQGFAAHFEGRA